MYSGGSSSFDSTSNFVITPLLEGDRVWVRVQGQWSSNFAIHCCFSTSSGYLVGQNGGSNNVIVG
ncbi:hypothetical protein DPMN_053178 [Dreissena polymorpha]|uniref:C1q domain-containing protein n=1 Tax=Dreissena polymorpha TaxID=45954 RepID=A0A9D4HP26_DREPO|nr:hypothetical protein DPMN_052169 [Dreissena polymorpha]KAH3727248.1 hypothetical protein DPMN_053178 [Dreissena polymorpha]